MMSGNTESKRVLITLCSIYKLLLDYLYVQNISSIYGYYGGNYGFSSNFSVIEYIFSWLIFLLFTNAILVITYRKQEKFSSLLLFIYYLFYFVPFTSMFYGGYKYNFIIYSILVWTFLVRYYYLFSKHPLNFTTNGVSVVPSSRLAFIVFIVLTILICLSVVYLSGKYTNFRLSFNEQYTYIYRVEAFDYQVSWFWGYLYSWSRLIIPLVLCIAVVNRRYIVASILFILKMLGFGYDGMRLDLLITILSVGIALVYRNYNPVKNIKRLFRAILLAMICICLLSVIEHFALGTGEIDRVITFRVLFLPNLIASWFITFFETHIPDFFRQSFLRFFGYESPYAGMGLDYIISDFIFGDNGRANNGLVADCMTNYGVVGFLFQPFFVTLWAHIVNKVSNDMHISIILMLAVYFSYCLTNNFFTIILFTNGGFIVILYLSVLKRIKIREKY